MGLGLLVKGRVQWAPRALQDVDFKEKKWSEFCKALDWAPPPLMLWGTTVFLFLAKLTLLCAFLEGHCGKWII